MREGRVKQSLDTRMEETAGAEQGSTLQEAEHDLGEDLGFWEAMFQFNRFRRS